MKHKTYLLLFITAISIIFFSCSKKTTPSKAQTPTEINAEDSTQNPTLGSAVQVSGPAVIVYKTKVDYFDKVPVNLSKDKKTLISYPATTDIYYKGELALPTKLNNGYLLDNRGITKGVAFLNISYKSYSTIEITPPPELIFKMILDDDPLVEMYNCGTRNEYQDIVNELNILIDKKKLKKLKNLVE